MCGLAKLPKAWRPTCEQESNSGCEIVLRSVTRSNWSRQHARQAEKSRQQDSGKIVCNPREMKSRLARSCDRALPRSDGACKRSWHTLTRAGGESVALRALSPLSPTLLCRLSNVFALSARATAPRGRLHVCCREIVERVLDGPRANLFVFYLCNRSHLCTRALGRAAVIEASRSAPSPS